jgi:hypothetical protein
MAFDKAMAMMGGKSKPQVGGTMKGEEKPDEKGEGGDPMSLHSHGDGTYHTEPGGEEHPTLGHALMHMAHSQEPDSKHMHISHDGLSMKSHGMNESGEHDGPHEHDDVEGVKDHVDSMMGNSEDGDDEDWDGKEEPQMSNGIHG